MNAQRIRKIAVMAFLSIFLVVSGGCANSPYEIPKFLQPTSTGQGQGQSQVDPRLSNSDDARFFSKSGFQACIGGALIGVGGCALSNSKDKEKCMLKAALIGCGVGMGVNYYLDQRRSEYSNQQQRLDAMLADVEADNRRLQNLNQTAATVLAEDRSALAQIKKDIAQKKVDTVTAKQRLQEVDANTKFLQDTLADLKRRQQQWREVAQEEKAAGANVAKLDAEINSMQTQIASLQAEIDSLFQQRSAIQLG